MAATAPQQTTFLGATVESFSCSAGWGEQTSTLTVTLVEDRQARDHFSPPAVGEPVRFRSGAFAFDGLLQSQERTEEVGGRRIRVTVTDPREVLAGVSVVLNSLTVPVEVPNVVNAYGYWEAQLGFGGAMSNESGMLWKAPFDVLNLSTTGGFTITPAGSVGVRPAVELLTGGGGGRFSCPVTLKGHAYRVDLSGLPAAPDFYRVGGDSQSLLDLVNQLCQDAGYDYMVFLDGTTIKFKTVSRKTQPSLGEIAAYVQSRDDASLRTYGTEFRNDYTNALLIGGDVNELVMVGSSGTSDMRIWPYWGEDELGNVVVGQGDPGVWHEADVYAPEIADVIGDTKYHVTLPELRCALADENAYESWAAYVIKWYPDKAKAVGLVNTVDADSDLAELFPDGLFQRDMIAQRSEDFKRFGLMNEEDYWTSRANRVFSFVQRVASEFYGAKFLVQVPFLVYWKMTPETFQVVSSDEVSDGGYLPETAQPLGLAYADIDRFQTEDDRFAAFVQFPYDKKMDLSSTSPENAVVSNGSLYMRCSVDDKIVYPKGTLYPYVVVTLAEPVFPEAPDPLGGVEDIAGVLNVPKDAVLTGVQLRHGSYPVRIHTPPYMPSAAAVPMRNNRATYGPWGTFGAFGASGVPGKTLVRRDESLTPWAYGGWDALNQVAAAQLAGAATNMQAGEVGVVTVPGTPEVQIGDALAAGGPEVTNVTCTAGTGGFTTSYEMKTYTPRFGAFQLAYAERVKRLGVAAMQMRRSMRAAFQKLRTADRVGTVARLGFAANTANAVRQATPVDAIYGTMHFSQKYGYRTQVSKSTLPEFAANIRADNDDFYWSTGGMSLEGLYRPFSTAHSKADAGDMPHFEDSVTGLQKTASSIDNLDPIRYSDIDILVSGKKFRDTGTVHRLKPAVKRSKALPDAPDPPPPTTPPARKGNPANEDGQKVFKEDQAREDPVTVDYDQARGIGLRSPVVLVGWGREYTGKPFPNAGDETKAVDKWSDDWIEKPARHPEKWRAGPLAAVFDNWLKVYTIPTFLKVTLDTDMDPANGAMASIKIKGTSIVDKVRVYEDWVGAASGLKAGANAWALYYQQEGRWYVFQASCPSA